VVVTVAKVVVLDAVVEVIVAVDVAAVTLVAVSVPSVTAQMQVEPHCARRSGRTAPVSTSRHTSFGSQSANESHWA
jgi:hypothetical protein